MMKSDNVSIRNINQALRNSFAAIRKDMGELKKVQGYQRVSHSELKSELLKLREDVDKKYVSRDKFNLMKLKLSEINDNFKRVWQLEKNVSQLTQDSLTYKDFDKEVNKIHNNLGDLRQNLETFKKDKILRPELDEVHGELTKRYDSLFVMVEKIRDGLDREIRDVEDRRKKDNTGVNKQLKLIQRHVSKGIDSKDIYKQIAELDNRLLSLRDELGKVSIKADENITQIQVDALVKSVNKEFDDLKDNLKVLSDNVSKRVTAQQVRKMVEDTNKELEMLRKYVANIDSFIASTRVKDSHIKALGNKIEKESATAKMFYDKTRKEVADRVTETQMNSLLKEVNGEFNRLNKEIGKIHGELDYRVNESQIKNFISDLNKEFDTMKKQIDDYRRDILKARESMRSDVTRYKKNIDAKADAVSVDKRFDDVGKSLKKAFNKINATVTRVQTEKLVEDVNKEFDDVRKDLKKFGKDLKDRVSRKQVENVLEDINSEFAKVHDAIDELKGLKKDVDGFRKGKVGTKAFDNKMDLLEKKYDAITKQVSRLKADSVTEDELGDYLSALKSSKEAPKSYKKSSKKPESEEEILTSVAQRRASMRKQESKGNKAYGAGNFLIVAAFVLLVLSIISFVYGSYGVMNIFAVVAIVSFLVGILLRVYVVFKKS